MGLAGHEGGNFNLSAREKDTFLFSMTNQEPDSLGEFSLTLPNPGGGQAGEQALAPV